MLASDFSVGKSELSESLEDGKVETHRVYRVVA
jgi:hypothetical protein